MKNLGEFGLIEQLAEMVKKAGQNPPELILGIGDDTAVWQSKGITLTTTDSLVEGVHFNLNVTSWQELGWKALATSLSDIAAMGGQANYALVALSLPEETEVEDVLSLYTGILELANKHGVTIAGGNISRALHVSLNVTVSGNATKGNILTRSAAVAGDKIAISGHPGTAAAGMETLKSRFNLKAEESAALKKAFLCPEPRLSLGQLLVKNGVKAAIDTSDGLTADLAHICHASGVSARVEIESLPLHPTVKASFPNRYLTLALSGGEDYELLFTAPSDTIEKIAASTDCPITIIGEITAGAAGEIKLVDGQGQPYKTLKAGWDHFANR